ncbi:hypothetical protein [Actinokineospora enzanensis]|uniref:hypothetical protein n=1 Tax=Actinokineospora enzanensis TaxID=155975 RepID=UPI0003762636|nr:hypothetical protein [Actinokineospora enzanensis]
MRFLGRTCATVATLALLSATPAVAQPDRGTARRGHDTVSAVAADGTSLASPTLWPTTVVILALVIWLVRRPHSHRDD